MLITGGFLSNIGLLSETLTIPCTQQVVCTQLGFNTYLLNEP